MTMQFIFQGSEYSAFLHDVVYLYMLVLNETLTEGADHRNGTDMFERAKGKIFRGTVVCSCSKFPIFFALMSQTGKDHHKSCLYVDDPIMNETF